MTAAQLDDLKAKGNIRSYTVTNIGVDKNKIGHEQSKAKYKNKKVEIDGILFHSIKESRRYLELRMQQQLGLIADLKLQVEFVLIEKNKTERACKYLADFSYLIDGKIVVEDVKSKATKRLSTYILKRKLLLEKFGITIKET